MGWLKSQRRRRKLARQRLELATKREAEGFVFPEALRAKVVDVVTNKGSSLTTVELSVAYRNAHGCRLEQEPELQGFFLDLRDIVQSSGLFVSQPNDYFGLNTGQQSPDENAMDDEDGVEVSTAPSTTPPSSSSALSAQPPDARGAVPDGSSLQPDRDAMTDDSDARDSPTSSAGISSSSPHSSLTHAAQHRAAPSRYISTSSLKVTSAGSRSSMKPTSTDVHSSSNPTSGGLCSSSKPTSAAGSLLATPSSSFGSLATSRKQRAVSQGAFLAAGSTVTQAASAFAGQSHPNSSASSQLRPAAAAVEDMVDDGASTSTPQLSPTSKCRAGPRQASSLQTTPAASVPQLTRSPGDDMEDDDMPSILPTPSCASQLRSPSASFPTSMEDVEDKTHTLPPGTSCAGVSASVPASFSASAPSAFSASSSSATATMAAGASHSALSGASQSSFSSSHTSAGFLSLVSQSSSSTPLTTSSLLRSSRSSSSSSRTTAPLPQVPLLKSTSERSATLTNVYGAPVAEDPAVPVVAYHMDCELHRNPKRVKNERVGRVKKIVEHLHKQGTLHEVGYIPVLPATDAELHLAQSKALTDDMRRRSRLATVPSFHPDNTDIYFSKGTAKAVSVAFGAGLELTNWLATRKNQTGVAIIRPPGHHGKPEHASGFCWANNVVGATKQHLARLEENGVKNPKVAIVDWDAHHGDGIEHAFKEDSRVLYISVHHDTRDGFFPGWPNGHPGNTGVGGNTINIPVDEGTGDREYVLSFLALVIPKIALWKPHGIIVACGLDAHEDDPLVGLHVSNSGFAMMTRMLHHIAKSLDVFLAFFLEGGYSFNVLQKVIDMILQILLDKNEDHPHTYTSFRADSYIDAEAYISEKEAGFEERLLRLVRWNTLQSRVNLVPAYEAALKHFPRTNPNVLARTVNYTWGRLPRVEYCAASVSASSVPTKAESFDFVETLIRKTLEVVANQCQGAPSAAMLNDIRAMKLYTAPHDSSTNASSTGASSTGASLTSSSASASSTSSSSASASSTTSSSAGTHSSNASSSGTPSLHAAQHRQQYVSAPQFLNLQRRPKSTRRAAVKFLADHDPTKRGGSTGTASASTGANADSSSSGAGATEGTAKRKMPPSKSKSPRQRRSGVHKRKKSKAEIVGALSQPPSRGEDTNAQAKSPVDSLPVSPAIRRGRNRSASEVTPSTSGLPPAATHKRSASATVPLSGVLPPVIRHNRSNSATVAPLPASAVTPRRYSHVGTPIVGTPQPGFFPLPSTPHIGAPPLTEVARVPGNSMRRHSHASTPSGSSSASSSARGPGRVVRAKSALLPGAVLGSLTTPAPTPLSMRALANALPSTPSSTNALTSPPFQLQATVPLNFPPPTLASSNGVLPPPFVLPSTGTLPASQVSVAPGSGLAKSLPPPLAFPLPSPTGTLTPLGTPTNDTTFSSAATTPGSTPSAPSSGPSGVANASSSSVFTFGTTTSLPPLPPLPPPTG